VNVREHQVGQKIVAKKLQDVLQVMDAQQDRLQVFFIVVTVEEDVPIVSPKFQE
jgi:hypothetical protein